MDEKELQELQEEVKKTIAKLLEQAKQFTTTAGKIRKISLEYFLNPQLWASLIKNSQEAMETSDLQEYSALVQSCFVEGEQLAERAQHLAYKTSSPPSLVAALDDFVQQSGLSLRLKQNAYTFIEKPSKPHVKRYMQQFLCALSIYRFNLNILDAYRLMIVHPNLDVNKYEDAVSAAKAHLEGLSDPKNPDPINTSWNKAKAIKSHLEQLKKEVQGFTTPLRQTVEEQNKRLTLLFGEGALLLQKSFNKFPNSSASRFLYDSPWHRFIKEISSDFYPNKVSHSMYSDSISINSPCPEWLLADIKKMDDILENKLPNLKKELLRRAFASINECLTNLKIEAECKNIELKHEAPDSFYKSSVYPGMLLYKNIAEGGQGKIPCPSLSLN
ncbi:hypothetical protein [Legionella jordanis]|uniref:Coiled-coil protein n=1 Tax=Legionella jordanis TaxID=456 RepID=A0A0W0VCE5_9GAMM|nr:hypothetical protein [Legionella jordanis]KTD17803.1 coiled-coil protein [Legionella jordanis]RMX02494.1 hypothetical protein EAW55_09620 [Legionella jordanis]RMX21663.1 hypothetical protein EAS68_02600 [Legionella jordanis]VEH11260.1 coiled-coil protein [Legionella jordanis]HAT8713772.1 hypothetical protein [Legionella jordanis]